MNGTPCMGESTRTLEKEMVDVQGEEMDVVTHKKRKNKVMKTLEKPHLGDCLLDKEMISKGIRSY